MSDKNLQFVLLGAGEPSGNQIGHSMDADKIQPVVLEWLLAGAAQITKNVCFISGHNFAEVKQRHPHLNFIYNPEWKETKAVSSFLAANLSDSADVITSYIDIIYRDNLLVKLADINADIAIAIDTNWLERYDNREQADINGAERLVVSGSEVRQIGTGVSVEAANAEFVGVVKFSKSVLKFINTFSEDEIAKIKNLSFADLIERLRLSGFDVHAYDVHGEWAELNDARDIGQFILGTKAETLMRFQKMIKKSIILDQVSFRVSDWNGNKADIVDKIIKKFDGASVIVRSSALSEDNFETAGAGVFDSQSNVNSAKEDDIVDAIDFVIGSYGENLGDNQVLVQHMLQDVSASGVVFTRTLSTAGPYWVVNYDDESSATDTITGGIAKSAKTYKINRNFENFTLLPEPLPALIEAVQEIEKLSGFDNLDIEFAVDGSGQIYIFQMRPLISNKSNLHKYDADVFNALAKAKRNFTMLQPAAPQIVGEKAIFGSMPDWNPAEIIGTHPGRLAAELYANLILDDVWAKQRAEYGYRNVQPQKLMQFFCGQPYVDVRASFNSFIPEGLETSLAHRLVDNFVSRLCDNPHFHDKVEFDVLPTCYSLDFKRWQTLLASAGFSDADISIYEAELRKLTHRAIGQPHGASEALEILQNRFKSVTQSDVGPIQKACHLLADAKQYGTLPFAHLARDGFVAVTLLRSGVAQGLLTNEAVSDFMQGLNSVTRQFAHDASKVKTGELSENEFLEIYGHLRPDTYNISSSCYRANKDVFLKPILAASNASHEDHSETELWNSQKEAFFEALLEQGIGDNASQLERFLISAVEGREYSKFLFTRNLSYALELFASFGASLGLDRHILADVPLSFFNHYAVHRDSDIFYNSVVEWQKLSATNTEVNHLIELPELITDSQDFDFFSMLPSSGNFIGESNVTAPAIFYASDDDAFEFSGKIIFIENADPGYDWLFGVGIAGLVTKFGGANSHMAIRAAEFGLPAVIGIGELRFGELNEANIIQIDCQNKIIRGLN